MYNLRYHIASLVAVFLALAVGLVLGTVVVERGVLNQQKKSIVKSLQDEFKKITTENKTLRESGQRYEAFGRDAVPAIIEKRLEGDTFLVMADSGANEGMQTVRDILRSAGATSAVVVVERSGFGESDPAIRSAVLRVPETQDTSFGILLADEWRRAGARPVTRVLQRAGVLDMQGLESDMSINGIVVVASDETSDPAAASVFGRLHAAGLPVVGVETSSRDTTVADMLVAAGYSAVDNVDKPEGAVSLVWLLARKAEGYFGVRPGALAAYPRLSP